MFVCMCNGVTEDMIKAEIAKQQAINGYVSKTTLACKLNVTTVCGACEDDIEELLKLSSTPSTPPLLKFIKID